MNSTYDNPANDALRRRKPVAPGQQQAPQQGAIGEQDQATQAGTTTVGQAGAPAARRAAPAPAQNAPQTFAQMQSAGMARPAPPPPPAPAQVAPPRPAAPVAASPSPGMSSTGQVGRGYEVMPQDQQQPVLRGAMTDLMGGDVMTGAPVSRAPIAMPSQPIGGQMPGMDSTDLYTGAMADLTGDGQGMSSVDGGPAGYDLYRGIQPVNIDGPPTLPPGEAPPTLPPSAPIPGMPNPIPLPETPGYPGTPALPGYDPSGGANGGGSGSYGTGGYSGSSGNAGTPFEGQLNDAITRTLAKPSGYDDAALNAEFDRLSGGIDDDFDARTTALREEMASRGLSDSSIQGGRLADTNVGRRTAKTDLAAQLGTKAAEAYGSDNAAAIASALGLRGQNNETKMAGDQLGLGYANLSQQAASDAARLAQSDRQFGANYGLDKARLDEQGRQFDTGTELEKAKMAEGQRQFGAQFGLDQQRAAEAARQFDAGYGLDASKQKEAQRQFDAQFGQGAWEFQQQLAMQREQMDRSGMEDLLKYLDTADLGTYDY